MMENESRLFGYNSYKNLMIVKSMVDGFMRKITFFFAHIHYENDHSERHYKIKVFLEKN